MKVTLSSNRRSESFMPRIVADREATPAASFFSERLGYAEIGPLWNPVCNRNQPSWARNFSTWLRMRTIASRADVKIYLNYSPQRVKGWFQFLPCRPEIMRFDRRRYAQGWRQGWI